MTDQPLGVKEDSRLKFWIGFYYFGESSNCIDKAANEVRYANEDLGLAVRFEFFLNMVCKLSVSYVVQLPCFAGSGRSRLNGVCVKQATPGTPQVLFVPSKGSVASDHVGFNPILEHLAGSIIRGSWSCQGLKT